jgi:hypothetical protein
LSRLSAERFLAVNSSDMTVPFQRRVPTPVPG